MILSTALFFQLDKQLPMKPPFMFYLIRLLMFFFSLHFLGEEGTSEVENMAGVEKMILQEVVQINLEDFEQHETDLWT